MCSFLFGACCQLQGSFDTALIHNPDESSQILTNSAAALSYETYGQQTNNLQNDNKIVTSINHSTASTKNPPINNDNMYGTPLGDEDDGYDSGNTIYISNSKRPIEYKPASSIRPITASSQFDHFHNDKVPVITTQKTFEPFTKNVTKDDDIYLPSSETSHEVNYSQEIPAQIPTGPYVSNEETLNLTNLNSYEVLNEISNENINKQGEDFTHSDISHPGFDAVILNDNLDTDINVYIAATQQSSTERFSSSISNNMQPFETTAQPFNKVTYGRPGFKPKTKPTQHTNMNANNEEDLVLVHTLSNDQKTENFNETAKPNTGTMSDNDIESIESIILMLNDTKTGPQYESTNYSATSAPIDYQDTTLYSSNANIYSTQMTEPNGIDYNKYGQNSYFITTRVPTTGPHITTNAYTYSTPSSERIPAIGEPIYVQSTIASNFGAVTPPFYNTVPFQDQTIDYQQHNAAAHVLLTSSSFRPQQPTKFSTASYVVGGQKITKGPTSTPTKIPTVTPIVKKTKKPTVVYKNTKKPPSTSYVTGPTTARPPSSPTPTVIVLGPAYNDYSSTTEHLPAEYIVQSKPIKQHISLEPEPPTPTIHITPKPTVNLVTSSSWTQKPHSINTYTSSTGIPQKQPIGSYIYTPLGTYSPAFQSSTPAYISQFDYEPANNYGTSPTYLLPNTQKKPTSQNAIYRPSFYSTQRPSASGALFSTPIYGNSVATPQPYPGFFGSTIAYGPQPIEYSTLKDELPTSHNDLNNFPPVRNPNLNISAATFNNGHPIQDYDFSTPQFVEDEALKDKMGLLVSKIVESLQDNFDDLADVVYETNKTNAEKNPTTTTSATKYPSNVTKKPIVKATTKKPLVRPAADEVDNGPKPTTTVLKPAVTPTIRPTTKRPTNVKVTTRKPASTLPQNIKKTTKKPITTLSTKKPLTKVMYNYVA